ncbi:MAG: hypothetical protein R3F53_06625 [Gammaproteobacteria bacterium]
MARLNMQRQGGFITRLLLLALVLAIGFWGYTVSRSVETFHEFLTENKQLKEALTRLTDENLIGYAKVVKQEQADDKLMTTLVFYQAARNDPDSRVLEGEFTIEGDIAHFDALVVKFDNQMVMDNKARSIYLWRRIYGDYMPPSEGFPLAEEGKEPARYDDLLGEQTFWDKIMLKKDYSEEFWRAIWGLANDTDKLKEFGITAVYGNAVYTKLEPGKLYQFKINDAGQIYPEVVKDF